MFATIVCAPFPLVGRAPSSGVSRKSFFATITLSISAFVIFLCCAGLLKLGILDLRELWTQDDDSTDTTDSSAVEVFNICGCCQENEDGSVAEIFFAIFNVRRREVCGVCNAQEGATVLVCVSGVSTALTLTLVVGFVPLLVPTWLAGSIYRSGVHIASLEICSLVRK